MVTRCRGASGARPRRVLRRAANWSLVCCLVLLAGCGILPGAASATGSTGAITTWGLVGGYSGINLSDAYRRGVRALLVEPSWSTAEPEPGHYDQSYLNSILAQVRSYRAMGFKVALDYGLEQAPNWVMAMPGARYVNQFGTSFTADPVPDLIFDTGLRRYARAYTGTILRLLGRYVYLVRVGGGYDGELDYPPPAGGESPDQYWAYGPAAQSASPVPGWKPCTGPATEARKFLTWYLDALVNFQQWQITTVRHVYSGDIAVLYPSVGFTAANERQALSDNLCGRTAIEQTGAFTRGWDQAQQVAALAGPHLVVYSTEVDDPAAVDELGRLAERYHRPLAGENGGFNGPAAMNRAVDAARSWHMTSFFWVRARQAYCHCNGWATIGDYQHDIAG